MSAIFLNNKNYSGGGGGDSLGTKLTATVTWNTVTFTDPSITDESVFDGPYVKDVLEGISSVSVDNQTVTFTFDDNLADGKQVYIWIR